MMALNIKKTAINGLYVNLSEYLMMLIISVDDDSKSSLEVARALYFLMYIFENSSSEDYLDQDLLILNVKESFWKNIKFWLSALRNY